MTGVAATAVFGVAAILFVAAVTGFCNVPLPGAPGAYPMFDCDAGTALAGDVLAMPPGLTTTITLFALSCALAVKWQIITQKSIGIILWVVSLFIQVQLVKYLFIKLGHSTLSLNKKFR